MRLKTLEELLKEEALGINPFLPNEKEKGTAFRGFLKCAIRMYREYLEKEKGGTKIALDATQHNIKNIFSEMHRLQGTLAEGDLKKLLSEEVAGNQEVLKNLIRETGMYVEYTQNCLAEIKDLDEPGTLRGEAGAFVRDHFPDLFSSAKKTLQTFKKQYAALVKPPTMPAKELAAVSDAKRKTLANSLTQLETQEAQYVAHLKQVDKLLEETNALLNQKDG